MKKKSLIVVPILLGLFLTSCNASSIPSSSTSDTSSTESSSSSESSSESSSSTSSEPAKQDFANAVFASATYTYDGNSHILSEVSGVPEGTQISYTGRSEFTNVGTYNASALLTKDGYNDKTLTATLNINKAVFSGISCENKSVNYDGNDHINDIQLVGVLPAGTTLNTTISQSGVEVTSAIEVGSYDFVFYLTNSNYESATFNVTLTIKAVKKVMPVFISSDGTIYFANGLDNSFLYSYTSTDYEYATREIKKIDSSSPKEFYKYNASSATFISNSLFTSSIKEVKEGAASVLYTNSDIDDFVKYSDTVYFYSSNTITAANSGIYKVDATDTSQEPIVTKVFEGKSDNLAIYNSFLYFTNGNDSNYVYKMNLSSFDTSLVLQEKVHEFTLSDNKLYCTVNGLLNDYIGYLDLSSSATSSTKLTDAAGEHLTVKDGYLYYNYTDLFSAIDSSVKGIYKISISGGNPTMLLQIQGINGFDVESSNSIIYIATNDLHLYHFDVSSNSTRDLLVNFVAPEEVPTNLGGQTISLGTKTYYLNMYAGKTLYCYDEATKRSSQLTTNKVVDFYIYGNNLYFNQVTMLTNNDLYVVDIVNGGEAVKLSSNDIRNMISDGTYIYATHYNWAGVAGGLSRMKLDGSEYVKFSNVDGAKNQTIKDGKLYYINCGAGQDNGNIEYISLDTITSASPDLTGTKLSSNIKNVKQFAFDGNNIFYIYNGTFDNSVRRTDFTSLGEGTKIASSKTNPNEIILNGNYVYYYSYASTATSAAGFYRVSKTASADGTQTLVLGYNSTYYGNNLSISDAGNLYFLNYIPKLVLGNAHFYQLNLTSKVVTKIN